MTTNDFEKMKSTIKNDFLRKVTNTLFCFVIMLPVLNSQSTLISYSASWKYFDQESEPTDQDNQDWNDSGYSAMSWPAGNAHLGYGDGDEATVINDQTLTAYFRHTFNVADPSIYGSLDLQLIYDDGAVVYFNGSEIWRVNMPTGDIGYGTFASANSGDNALATITLLNSLQTGDNVLAVEVHQRSSGSSDISFDFKMSASIPGAIHVDRGPYLQKLSSENVTIHWRTSELTESIIDFGQNLVNLDNQVSDLTPKTEHIVTLTGLQADIIYYYRISNSDSVLVPVTSELYFKTSPVPGTDSLYTFWVLGDCGTANSNQRAVRDAYYAYIDSGHTDGILLLGDNAYNDGTDDEYQYAIFEDMYEAKLQNTVLWSCLGNHDGHSANSNTQSGPYYDIFDFPTNAEAGGIASGTEAYYSFDYGNVHFISLESYETDRSVGGPMYNWCLSDIQNTTQDWIVAFWHHPSYSKGSHDSDTESRLIEMRQNFLPMLEANGVDVVFSGHSHSYERSYFLNGHYGLSNSFDSLLHTVGTNGIGDGQIGGDGAYTKEATGANAGEGMVYITAGSSGKTSSGSLDHEAMFHSVSLLGSCVLEVNGNQMDIKFLRSTGVINDSVTIIKIPPCVAGTGCNDGNDCTVDDRYDNNCNCVGGPSNLVIHSDDSGSGSLRSVIECSMSGDSIFFASGLNGDTIRLNSQQISLGKDLIFSGNGQMHTIIDASSIIRAFQVTSNTQTIFQSLRIIGGTANEGSVFDNQGSLHLQDVHLVKNPDTSPSPATLINGNPGSQTEVWQSVILEENE